MLRALKSGILLSYIQKSLVFGAHNAARLIKTVRFAGKDEKAQAVCSCLVHALGCLPNLFDPVGMFHYGHRGQSLHTVGSPQQHRRGEGGGISSGYR